MARMHEASEETKRETRMGHKRAMEKGAHHDGREDRGRDGPSETRMAKGGGKSPWNSGSDAAYIEPRLIPDYELLPRDDSGGPEWDPYTQQFGDGGYVTGEKAHLSARGGKEAPELNDEESNKVRGRASRSED